MFNAFTFGQANFLTTQEKQWLKNKKDSLFIIPECYYPPYIFSENDTIVGASVDLLKIIEKDLGIEFKIQPCDKLERVLQRVNERDYNIVTSVKKNAERSQFMQFTAPYYDIPVVIVTKRNKRDIYYYDKLEDYKIAVYGQTSLHYYLKTLFPHYNLLVCDSDYACLESVREGKADITTIDIASFSHLCMRHKIRNLQVANIVPFNYNLALATGKNQDTLQSILNKAILNIPPETRNEILNKWVVFEMDEQNWFEKYFYHLIIALGIVLFFVILIISWNRTLTRKVTVKTLELGEKNQELEQKEGILVSTNKALVRAKEKAEESDRLKTAFLNNMSHELRTPMNGIIGFSEMLILDDITEEDRKYYHSIIKKSSDQLLNIINDILDLAKIEANQISLFEQETDLHELCNDIITLHSLEAQNKGLELKRNYNPDQPVWIIADKQKLTQILRNLFHNGIKFTEQGSVTLGYEIVDNLILISVTDTGIGIEEKIYEHIFDRFTQAENTASRRYEGTGLGLPISKGLVEKLGGEIKVKSELGKGTIFEVRIPYKPDLKKAQEELKAASKDLANNTEHTILIAEDEEINFMYLSQLFDKMNVKYIRATNGQEAVDMVKANNEIDLILMDIKMPIKDGIEATGEIKAYNPVIPIIAITAYAFNEDRERAMQAGCDDYLAKPVSPQKILQAIEKYVNS